MKSKEIFAFLVLFFFVSSLSIFAQGQEPVDPVNWRELVPFLIDISDWEAEGEAEGSTISMANFKVSEVERSYTAEDKELNIKIVDGGYVQMMYAGVKMAMNFEIDTSEEYVKKITIKGFSGIERYDYEDKEAEVIILIGERFLVQLEGNNFKDASLLTAIAETLDLKGIANLAK